jgi:hypothetical protein
MKRYINVDRNINVRFCCKHSTTFQLYSIRTQRWCSLLKFYRGSMLNFRFSSSSFSYCPITLHNFIRCIHLSTQNPLHHIGFGDVLLRMLTPKDLNIIIVKVTCIVSLKCKIIFNITSTYITSVIYDNVGFLAGTITLEVAYSMTMVALNIRGAADGCG